jgi:nickel-dependent lactate racemase
MSTIGYGFPNRTLQEYEIEAIVASSLSQISLDNKRVLVIIPDHTRTMPLPVFFKLITKYLSGHVYKLDFLVALGTHPALSETELFHLVGITKEDKEEYFPQVNLYNHEWNNPESLITLGIIPASETSEISQGRLSVDIPVRINRRILDYDHLFVCGPVFPHEVVGFSGGNKYFYPGIAGGEIINRTHWLGALITSYEMIGTKDTPVRKIIDRAASLIPTERHAFCSVVTHNGLNGLFYSTPEEAFSKAADLSAKVHIRWCKKRFRRVLSVIPEMYDEIWTGAKGMYKLEPVIEDGGEVIIYAPHIKEFSAVHGEVIQEIGYHVIDYFTKQWDKYSNYPLGVLAHSTHLRGIGSYENGIEKPRIKVTLATGIPEAACKAVNLNYLDPQSITPLDWAGKEDEGILMVPRAGEYLYRLLSTE